MQAKKDFVVRLVNAFAEKVSNNYETLHAIESANVSESAERVAASLCVDCFASDCDMTKKDFECIKNECIETFCLERGIAELDYDDDYMMDDYCQFEYDFMWDGLNIAYISIEIEAYKDEYRLSIEVSIGHYGQYIPFYRAWTFEANKDESTMESIVFDIASKI